jgi:hypothetical protein
MLTLLITRAGQRQDAWSKNISEAQGQILTALKDALERQGKEVADLKSETTELRLAYRDCQDSRDELQRRVSMLERRLKSLN